jgi:hypothetical protein
MATTYEKLRCGHFTVVNNKLHFTGDVVGSCRFWTEGVLREEHGKPFDYTFNAITFINMAICPYFSCKKHVQWLYGVLFWGGKCT